MPQLRDKSWKHEIPEPHPLLRVGAVNAWMFDERGSMSKQTGSRKPAITSTEALEPSTLLTHRMKAEGEERTNLSSQVLKMSLDYHFVTPLTSMTIRGLKDEDGLEPIIDKTSEGTGIGDLWSGGSCAKVLLAVNSFPFSSQILSP